MTNTERKQQILKQIEELKSEVEKIDSQGEVWRPNLGDEYYYIRNNFGVGKDHWGAWDYEKDRVTLGNVFKTEAQAEKRAKYLGAANRLMNAYEAIEQGVNWNNTTEEKYYPYYSHDNKSVLHSRAYVAVNNLFNFDSEQTIKQFIKDHEQDLLIYFGVNS